MTLNLRCGSDKYEMRRGRFAKDGLIQYRIVCQQVNAGSLEEFVLQWHYDKAKAIFLTPAVRAKSLGAISSLIRHNKPGVVAFTLANDYGALREALGSDKLGFKGEMKYKEIIMGTTNEFLLHDRLVNYKGIGFLQMLTSRRTQGGDTGNACAAQLGIIHNERAEIKLQRTSGLLER
ncbi:hypothetical protein C5167_007456 [Papaver somniferum]|nr:hypothetical protein C5167_007456 [Papaver somniferum]